MKYALVHDKIVTNIIVLDNELIEADIDRFDKEHAEYESALKQYKKDKKKFDNAVIKYKDELADYNLEVFDAKMKLSGQARKDKLKSLKAPQYPKDEPLPPKKPKPAMGYYEPPKDHTIVELKSDQACNIGWIHNGKGFDNPETQEDESKTIGFGGVIKKLIGGKDA